MKKYIALILAVILSFSIFASCKGNNGPATDTKPTETEPAKEETLKPRAYPNAMGISAYNMLTDTERDIYENIAHIIASPTPGKVYTLKKRVYANSFNMILDILKANFGNYESLLENITYEEIDGKIASVQLDGSFDIEAFNEKNGALMEKADEIISALPKKLSQREIVFELIDILVSSVDLCGDSTENNEYTALVEGKAGSEGLSKAFTLLCKKAGLDCISVYGFEEKHGYDISTGSYSKYFEITDPKIYWNIVKINDKWFEINISNVYSVWADGFESYINLNNIFRTYYSAYYFNRTGLDNMMLPTTSSWSELAYEFTACYEVIEFLKSIDIKLNYTYNNDYYFAVRFKDLSEATKFTEYNEKLIYDKSDRSYYIYTMQDFYEDDGRTVKFYLILNATGEEMKNSLKYKEYEFCPTFAVYPNTTAGYSVYDVSILFEAPNVWSSVNHLNGQFLRFANQYNYKGFAHSLVFVELISIDENFVFDERLLYTLYRPGDTIDSEELPEMGVNSYGVEYASYLQNLEDEIFGHVYFKISDKYIISIEFTEHIDNRDIIEKVIDSVRIAN